MFSVGSPHTGTNIPKHHWPAPTLSVHAHPQLQAVYFFYNNRKITIKPNNIYNLRNLIPII